MSPIIVFAFNRLVPFTATIESLLTNPEAKDSDLYIFVDGPREGREGEAETVASVRKYSESIKGFKTITLKFSDINRGLGPSIISGVSQVIERHGTAIVLEDDLIVQPNFLNFINEGLKTYRDNKNVWSICGYSNKVSISKDYPFDAYFSTRSSSWGWATWADRWQSVDWTFDLWDEWKKLAHKFNKWGGSDCFNMLADCRDGKNKSWAIRFCFNQFIQDKISLFPTKSLVINNGFDGSGTNCRRWSRFKYELMSSSKEKFLMPTKIVIDRHIHKSALKYHSIPIRVFSKIMYALT
ncbi:MAG: glycosyl transferase [Muribaculaceae bacterium]|nr:glycosyl transferase [Muribaculaceae bacterium]